MNCWFLLGLLAPICGESLTRASETKSSSSKIVGILPSKLSYWKSMLSSTYLCSNIALPKVREVLFWASFDALKVELWESDIAIWCLWRCSEASGFVSNLFKEMLLSEESIWKWYRPKLLLLMTTWLSLSPLFYRMVLSWFRALLYKTAWGLFPIVLGKSSFNSTSPLSLSSPAKDDGLPVSRDVLALTIDRLL